MTVIRCSLAGPKNTRGSLHPTLKRIRNKNPGAPNLNLSISITLSTVGLEVHTLRRVCGTSRA